MAALQHAVGGPSASPPLSFAGALVAPISKPSAISDHFFVPVDGLHKGFPAANFTQEQLNAISEPFNWTLIGKFSQGFNKKHPDRGRPPVEKLRDYFVSLDLKGAFSIGLLDNRHLLIQLQTEEDYLRIYSRMVWYVGSITMRIFNWTPFFHVERESSVVPVWITMPRLPIQFFDKRSLFPIAALIGRPLRLDVATATLKRPSVARVQIELDLLKTRPSQIWIGMGEKDGFWQKVDYENVPSYCSNCFHMGHAESLCRIKNPELQAPLKDFVASKKQEHTEKPKQMKASGSLPRSDLSSESLDNSQAVSTEGKSVGNAGKKLTVISGPNTNVLPVVPSNEAVETLIEGAQGESCMQMAVGATVAEISTQNLAAPVFDVVGVTAPITPASNAVLSSQNMAVSDVVISSSTLAAPVPDIVFTPPVSDVGISPSSLAEGESCAQGAIGATVAISDVEISPPSLEAAVSEAVGTTAEITPVPDIVISSEITPVPVPTAPISDAAFNPPVSDAGISPSSLAVPVPDIAFTFPILANPVENLCSATIPMVLTQPETAALADTAPKTNIPEPDPARVTATESVIATDDEQSLTSFPQSDRKIISIAHQSILNATEDEENLGPTDPPFPLTSSSVYPILQSPVTYGTLTSPIQTHSKFAVPAILQSGSLSMSRGLNVEAEAWLLEPRAKNTGRILPPSLAQDYDNQN